MNLIENYMKKCIKSSINNRYMTKVYLWKYEYLKEYMVFVIGPFLINFSISNFVKILILQSVYFTTNFFHCMYFSFCLGMIQ